MRLERYQKKSLVTWCGRCFGKRTERQWRDRRRLRRTGAVDTKSPAIQNIEGSKRQNFCAGIERTPAWTSGDKDHAVVRRERSSTPRKESVTHHLPERNDTQFTVDSS